jgi:hypothetical protein
MNIFNYPYLSGSLYLLAIWFVIFFLNKKDKKEQILMGLPGLIIGPLVEKMHLNDWWHPSFIFNTPIKIEDLIFGFSVAGIISVGYETILRKEQWVYRRKKTSIKYLILLCIVFILILFGPYLLGLSSFWTSVFSTLMGALLILRKRQDLLPSMLASGLLMVIIAVPAYLVGLMVNPNWIQDEWYLDKLSGIYIYKIPIEELIWFFMVGFGMSAIWELRYGVKFIKRKKT